MIIYLFNLYSKLGCAANFISLLVSPSTYTFFFFFGENSLYCFSITNNIFILEILFRTLWNTRVYWKEDQPDPFNWRLMPWFWSKMHQWWIIFNCALSSSKTVARYKMPIKNFPNCMLNSTSISSGQVYWKGDPWPCCISLFAIDKHLLRSWPGCLDKKTGWTKWPHFSVDNSFHVLHLGYKCICLP